MELGDRTRKRFQKNKTDVDGTPMSSLLCKRLKNITTTDASTTEQGIQLWQKQDDGIQNR